VAGAQAQLPQPLLEGSEVLALVRTHRREVVRGMHHPGLEQHLRLEPVLRPQPASGVEGLDLDLLAPVAEPAQRLRDLAEMVPGLGDGLLPLRGRGPATSERGSAEGRAR
jgi:hypothetical protein